MPDRPSGGKDERSLDCFMPRLCIAFLVLCWFSSLNGNLVSSLLIFSRIASSLIVLFNKSVKLSPTIESGFFVEPPWWCFDFCVGLFVDVEPPFEWCGGFVVDLSSGFLVVVVVSPLWLGDFVLVVEPSLCCGAFVVVVSSAATTRAARASAVTKANSPSLLESDLIFSFAPVEAIDWS